MPGWIYQSVGFLVVLAVLSDVFLTVLYARIGTGFISHWLACFLWRQFKRSAGVLGRRRELALSFGGPAILVIGIAVWVGALAFGFALIILPTLGNDIGSTTGPTPTGMSAALYVAGDSMTTVGTSDIAPPALRGRASCTSSSRSSASPSSP